ncbi:hypothetical protein ACIPI6_32725 [Pseudomonas protegens]|uniref:hypothetical protein n=1 Tax=Pseudomonas protegens TaxID=380021 RepID=UPI00382EA0EF
MTACKEHFLNPVKGYSACPGCEVERLRAELKGLRTGFDAQNEVIVGLRKDAERYRWLRDGAGYCDTRDIPGMAPARMDEFIDAAMGKGGEA